MPLTRTPLRKAVRIQFSSTLLTWDAVFPSFRHNLHPNHVLHAAVFPTEVVLDPETCRAIGCRYVQIARARAPRVEAT